MARLRFLKRALADVLEQRAKLPKDWRQSINYEAARLRRMIKDASQGGSRQAARNAVARTTASGGRSRSVGADAAARRASVKMRWAKSRGQAKVEALPKNGYGKPDYDARWNVEMQTDKAIDMMADRLAGQAMNGRLLDALEIRRQQYRHHEYRPSHFNHFQPSGLRNQRDNRAGAGRLTMSFDNDIKKIREEAAGRIKDRALAGTLNGDALLEERNVINQALATKFKDTKKGIAYLYKTTGRHGANDKWDKELVEDWGKAGHL